MITFNKETPILLIIQDKIDIINSIYIALQQLNPHRLYLFYNAPANEDEKIFQEKVQSLFNDIDWNCKIKSFFNKRHLKDSALMLKAVNRFFRQETEGIILDSQSVPLPYFFAFCSCLLEKYRHDERIGHISGYDFRKSKQGLKTNDSYYFSNLIHTNRHWASWRRVWQDMAAQLKSFRAFKKQNIMADIPAYKPFQFLWNYWYKNDDNRDVKHEYISLINNRLAIVPNMRNLSLIGYELPDMNHPAFMVSPLTDELDYQELKYHLPAITPNKPEGTAFLKEKLLSLNVKNNQCLKIPRIIHQIYEDPAGPSVELLHIAETWKEKMPHWEYRFWNRKAIHEFLASVCPDFSAIYYAYPFNVQRWDAIRYLILYHTGGLYVDFDYECVHPLDVLLAGSTCCMGMEPSVNSRVYKKSLIIGNALMAAKPKHPYMAAIIEDMKTNFANDYKRGDATQIMETTGPFLVTRVYEELRRKKSVTLLPADLVAPLTMKEVIMFQSGNRHPDMMKKLDNAFAIHYYLGTWVKQTAEGKQ